MAYDIKMLNLAYNKNQMQGWRDGSVPNNQSQD